MQQSSSKAALVLTKGSLGDFDQYAHKTLITINLTTMSEIAEKVKAIVADKLGVDAAEVSNEASFTNDLGADSLETVELIMELETVFGISIPEEEAQSIGTVGQAIEYIEKAKA